MSKVVFTCVVIGLFFYVIGRLWLYLYYEILYYRIHRLLVVLDIRRDVPVSELLEPSLKNIYTGRMR